MRIFLAFVLAGVSLAVAAYLTVAEIESRTLPSDVVTCGGSPCVVHSRMDWQIPAAVAIGVIGVGAGVAIVSSGRRRPAP